MPQLPKRETKNSKGNEPKSRRQYTRMALACLSAGLSWQDIRHMKYTHLMQLLWEWDDMHGAESDETVDATPADVMALTRL